MMIKEIIDKQNLARIEATVPVTELKKKLLKEENTRQ